MMLQNFDQMREKFYIIWKVHSKHDIHNDAIAFYKHVTEKPEKNKKITKLQKGDAFLYHHFLSGVDAMEGDESMEDAHAREQHQEQVALTSRQTDRKSAAIVVDKEVVERNQKNQPIRIKWIIIILELVDDVWQLTRIEEEISGKTTVFINSTKIT